MYQRRMKIHCPRIDKHINVTAKPAVSTATARRGGPLTLHEGPWSSSVQEKTVLAVYMNLPVACFVLMFLLAAKMVNTWNTDAF